MKVNCGEGESTASFGMEEGGGVGVVSATSLKETVTVAMIKGLLELL